MTAEFRTVGAEDSTILADLFSEIDAEYFRPHPFTADEAAVVANHGGRDVYAVLVSEGRAVAYGMLRGFDEGYSVPSLGIAVRTSEQGRGLGLEMMAHLHVEARHRGATVVRLRVHEANHRARRLYERLGYLYAGQERGELVMLVGLGQEDEPAGQGSGSIRGVLLACDAPEWQELLNSTTHDMYHLPAYVALCAAQDDAQGSALLVSDGERSLLLPLMVRGIEGGGRDVVSPYGTPGPIGTGADDKQFLELALAAGLQKLREEGVVSAFIRMHPILNHVLPDGMGTVVVHGESVSIDLDLPTEQLWSQMRRNHRHDITRALDLGYVARMDESWDNFGAFKDLYRGTMQRRGAASFYLFDDAHFDGLRRALGERLHLCVVEGKEGVVSAGLFVETEGLVQAHLVGSDQQSAKVQPTKLMFHFAANWAKARGNRVLHLGGGVGGSSDSLLHFKAGFSPLRHPFATLRIVIDQSRYDLLVHSRHPSLDPADMTGFFPLYRAP